MKFVRLSAVIAASLLLNGCMGGLVPSNRTDSAAMKSAENISVGHDMTFKKVVEGEKTPAPAQPQVKVDGKNNSVQMNFEAAKPATNSYKETVEASQENKAAGGYTEEATSFSKRKIPLWVALIGMAVGIFLIIAAWKYAKRSSPAIAAASTAVEGWATTAIEGTDEAFRKLISEIREEASSETDQKTISAYHKIIGKAEAARGKANVHLATSRPTLNLKK